MVLTKDELLNIQFQTKNIELGSIGEVTIRQISNQEADKLERIKHSYGKITQKDDGTIDLSYTPAEKLFAEQHAKLTCVMYSLSVEEKYTVEELNQLPKSILETIYQSIRQFNDI